ncbi:MAG: efflux RND transporter periplasmic adaptor subunit [Opitutaceae bacterium]
MSRKSFIAGSAIVLCGAVFLFLLKRAGGGPSDASSDPGPTLVTVQTAKIQRTTLRGYVDGYGSVEPRPATADEAPAGARVASPVSGTITQARVTEGQRVDKGEVLFELDSRVAKVAVDAAQIVAARQEELYKQGNTSLNSVQDAQARLAAAKAQLALLRVIAPLTGTVTRVGVRPGEAVDPATVLAEVINLNRLAVQADIPVAEADPLRTGQSVEIESSRPIAATLTYIGSAVDSTMGTIPVVASIPAGSGLRPGQFVAIRIAVAKHSDVLAAPEASVVTDISGKSVIAVISGGKATVLPVKTGLRDRGLVEVSAPGLKPGAIVATVGAYGLPDGTRIRVAN